MRIAAIIFGIRRPRFFYSSKQFAFYCLAGAAFPGRDHNRHPRVSGNSSPIASDFSSSGASALPFTVSADGWGDLESAAY